MSADSMSGPAKGELVRSIDWGGAFWVASGVPALVLFSIGGIAGMVGIVLIMFFAPLLARLALKFGAPEFFTIALLGLFALSRISGGSIWYSLLLMGLGLTISTVGLDPVSYTNRFTMGILALNWTA